MREQPPTKRRHFLAGSAAHDACQRFALPAIPSCHTAGRHSTARPGLRPALVTRSHANMVYDALYGVDGAVRPWTQMAAGPVIEDDDKVWKITSRDGLRFHDGEKVLTRCCCV